VSDATPQGCREARDQMWAGWPQTGSVPEATLVHARGCEECRSELEAFRELFLLSTGSDGEPLSWAAVLPSPFWPGSAAAIADAPRNGTKRRRPWRAALAAAAAVAAALLWFAWPFGGGSRISVETLENRDMIEHLDLFLDWETARGLLPDPRFRPGAQERAAQAADELSRKGRKLLRRNFLRYQAMSDDARWRLAQRYEVFKGFAPAQREEFLRRWEEYGAASQAQRQKLRQSWGVPSVPAPRKAKAPRGAGAPPAGK